MDQLSSILEAFPPREDDLSSKKLDGATKRYVTSLASASSEIIACIEAKPVLALTLVNPAVNSIGHLLVLEKILAKWSTLGVEDQAAARNSITHFISEFSSWQIRYVGNNLLSLLDTLSKSTVFPPPATVELLAKAIPRIDPSGSMFTSTHLKLAKLAYEANSAEHALVIINRPVTAFPDMEGARESRPLCSDDIPPSAYISKSTGLTHEITPSAVLEYYHYCARIYTSRREWDSAHKTLEKIISHPTKDKVISKLMLNAYRKWVLIGVLCNGRAPTMPSCVSQATRNLLTSLAPKYGPLANIFHSDDVVAIKEVINLNWTIWREDGNESLIDEIVVAYQQWQILNLRLIYRQVPIAQIQRETSSMLTARPLQTPEEVVTLVQGMIDSGMLKGQVQPGPDAENSFVLFAEDTESLTEAEFAREVARAYHSVELLGNDYQTTNERLSSNKEYIKHVVREQSRSKQDGSDGGFDATIEEEDLMTGIVSNA